MTSVTRNIIPWHHYSACGGSHGTVRRARRQRPLRPGPGEPVHRASDPESLAGCRPSHSFSVTVRVTIFIGIWVMTQTSDPGHPASLLA